MSNRSHRARCRSWIATALLGVTAVCSNSANAAIYTGFWDPLFNVTFPNSTLGWRGSITIDMSNGCLSDPTLDADCTAAVTGGSLSFYNTLPANTIGGAIFGGLPGSFPAITQLSVAGGVPTGIALAEAIDIGIFSFGTASSWFTELNFTLAGPSLMLTQVCEFCEPQQYSNTITPDITFFRVPEPGSLALVVAAGLIAAGISRRKRSQASP